ncbi:hypothetical protein pipiens_001194 [Culex pipiens pipiens]|uniref:Uncharacterized protein n=1 Tax=Culex pipiens pipiens TaxID=38569 RepID=A0ABD1DHX5_CULPP
MARIFPIFHDQKSQQPCSRSRAVPARGRVATSVVENPIVVCVSAKLEKIVGDISITGYAESYGAVTPGETDDTVIVVVAATAIVNRM